jgi:hypothetical protein
MPDTNQPTPATGDNAIGHTGSSGNAGHGGGNGLNSKADEDTRSASREGDSGSGGKSSTGSEPNTRIAPANNEGSSTGIESGGSRENFAADGGEAGSGGAASSSETGGGETGGSRDTSTSATSNDGSSDSASSTDGDTSGTSNAERTESRRAESEPSDLTSAVTDTNGKPEDEPARIGERRLTGGTQPSWWDWLVRHRWPVTAVIGVVVLAVVGTVVLVSSLADGPGDVVRDYMDAIQSGDTATALDMAGGRPDGAAFLTGDALADGWRVDGVVERHRQDDDADVDVTLREGDRTAQGRFHLVDEGDGWTIEAPFARVEVPVGGLGAVELGGVRVQTQAQTLPVLLFPGVYDLYPSLADRVTFTPGALFAVPQESADGVQRLTTTMTVTETGTAQVQKAVDARVDECADSTDPTPTGCPFTIEHAMRGLYDIGTVEWTVVTRPVAYVATRNGTLPALVVRRPGTVTVTGSGTPDDGAPTTFSATCEFGLANMTIAMSADGFSVGGKGGDPYGAALSTRCY